MAEVEDDLVDVEEEELISDLFAEWENSSYSSGDKGHRSRARKKFDEFVDNGYPFHFQRDTVEFLSLHFSKGNMLALMYDLYKVANIDGDFSEREESFLSAVKNSWGIEDNELKDASNQDRNLRSGHFCNAFRLKRETTLSDLLRDTFQVDALAPLIKPLEQEASSFCFAENHGQGHIIEKSFAPRLETILNEVCGLLEITEEFSFYVTNDPQQGAWIWGGISSYGKNFITLTSELVSSLSDDELRFVIGHEIGHWIFNINDVTALIGAAYDGEERTPSISMQNLLATWRKCAEFSADRVGLLCCGSIEVATECLFRVCTGLDAKSVGFSLDSYVEKVSQSMPSLQEMELFSQKSHPPLPLRMKALSVFSKSDLYLSWKEKDVLIEKDDKLTSEMDSIVRLVDFSSNDPLHFKRLLAITLGGFYLATVDGQIAEEEVSRIRDVLFRQVMNPEPIIDHAWNLLKGNEDIPSLLQGLLVDLVSHDENEKYEMMDSFIEVALSDGVLHRNETQALMDIAQFLGIERENLLRVLVAKSGRGLFFEKQVPQQVNQVLGRVDPFYDGTLEERIEQASNPEIDHNSMLQLSQDADPRVRLSVFFNESTPEETKLALLDSPSFNRALNELNEVIEDSEQEEDLD